MISDNTSIPDCVRTSLLLLNNCIYHLYLRHPKTHTELFYVYQNTVVQEEPDSSNISGSSSSKDQTIQQTLG